MARVIPHGHPDGLVPPANGGNWYLVQLAHKLLDFRQPELEAVAGMCGVPQADITFRMPPTEHPEMMPFWYMTLPNDEVARAVTARTMLAKGMYEIWGEGATWEELEASIRAYPEEKKAPWLGPDQSFKVVVGAYGSTLSMEDQLKFMEKVAFIPFQGAVNLKTPDVTFWLMITDIKETMGLGEPQMVPYRIYFGRKVAEYNHIVALQYTLKKRPYIGPTSMDPEMAFIMCNMAQVKKGQFVFDPYVGTGSITVAAAHHRAFVMGADIDIRVVRMGKTDAKGNTLDVFTNFDFYGTRGCLAGLFRLDMHRNPFRDGIEELYHAIVGDPPYGVRAGGKKSRALEDLTIKDRETHIPSTDPYNLGECLRDLLDFAARTLVLGGRLVYFLPATPDTYDESEIPGHPALKLMHNSEQLLTARYSRRLITMEKVAKYDAGAAAAYHAARPDPTMRIDRIHSLVYEQYERDEKGKVVYPEGALNKKKFRSKML